VNAPRERFEPWAWFAFALAAATLVLFLYLGSRPGGERAHQLYRHGPLALGGAAAVFLLGALFHCLRRRPMLQRRRVWPLAALAGTLWFCSLPIAYPSPRQGKYSPTRFRLPFEGRARVLYGGEEVRASPFLFDPSRRFAVCFEPVASGAALEVVAPMQATVVAKFEGPGGPGVVLHAGGEEHCVLEGFAEFGGFSVGQALGEGSRLGRVDARLTMYLADRPDPGRGEGIPLRFSGYLLGGRAVSVGVPSAGQELESGPPGR
jgi:hypothetical protein